MSYNDYPPDAPCGAEYHQPQNRGSWIPADIENLQLEHKITVLEMVLLSRVDRLVNSKGAGCFASNKYLAEQMGVSLNTISTMISKLIQMGLLIQIKFDGRRRLLETCWSRIETNKRQHKKKTSC